MRTEANSFMVPNETTIAAMKEFQAGQTMRFDTIEEFMEDLTSESILDIVTSSLRP